MKSNVYSASPGMLDERYDEIVQACHNQGITHIGILASVTGKLLATPEQLLRQRQRLEEDGLTVWAEVFGVGHPAMGQYYDAGDSPPDPPLFWDGDLVVEPSSAEASLLPRGWQYAVNEFGYPVYCTSCANQACNRGNQSVMRKIAAIFDEVWYDDEFRLDGDQGAGEPHTSTAACYCDHCLADLSRRLGRPITREEVLTDQALHDAWIEQKTDKMAGMWKAICEAGREVNPNLRIGLMIRWGGEERDGIDLDKLLPHFGDTVNLRAGEGHFTAREYSRPEGQAIEYLVTSYHVSWYPQDTAVWSETTYFEGVTRQHVLKKVALALAAGANEVAYCPCVPGWVEYQNYLGADRPLLESWHASFADASAHYQPIVILRSVSAGRGDRRPTQRVRDRQPFPLFSMAGLFSTVVRQGHWRDTGDERMLAITGRTVWDFSMDTLGDRELILDGAALLECSPLNGQLGITDVAQGRDGRVTFAGGGFQANGLLYTSQKATIIPYVWQDVPEPALTQLLADVRRVLGPRTPSVVVTGDLRVLPVHYRRDDHDAIMLVNLTHEERHIKLDLTGERNRLSDPDGRPLGPQMALQPDEIRVVLVRE